MGLHYNQWPSSVLDHIDGNKHNNAINNLILSSTTENAKNSPRRFDNTSGHTGVSWCNKSSQWVASITTNGTLEILGRRHSLTDAVSIRKHAEVLYGFSSIHGRDSNGLGLETVDGGKP